MAHPRGPRKETFLKKINALIVAAYDGNLAENRIFTSQVTSDNVGEMSVKYHVCATNDSEDDTTFNNLGNTSTWKKTGATLAEKDVCSLLSITYCCGR